MKNWYILALVGVCLAIVCIACLTSAAAQTTAFLGPMFFGLNDVGPGTGPNDVPMTEPERIALLQQMREAMERACEHVEAMVRVCDFIEESMVRPLRVLNRR